MTDRLYYTDPYGREFDAAVVRVERRDGRTIVILDRTSFYPTSGGQPFDVGTLGGVRVLDVIDDEEGEVLHVVDDSVGADLGRPGAEHTPPLQVGQRVHGVIDWPRRFDHMQQHTGQHVLSGAFDRLFGARTVSFHLGASVSTIDLARELAPADIAAAEAEANRIVWEDRPVTIRFADAKEAEALRLRKPSAREGTLRLIDVEEFDLSACGGTHVARTGGIGIIAIASWERFKGGQRLEFLCGGRALAGFRSQRDTLSAATGLLSVSATEMPAAIERLLADAKDQKRAGTTLQMELARYRGAELAASAEATDRGRLVARAIDADANGLKSLAASITASPGHIAVLVSTSTPALVVVARSAGVNVKANDVLAALTSRFGGRGGGKPELAQGGGLNAPAEQILEAARAALLL
jgi:alanyl-tRNA synthetase